MKYIMHYEIEYEIALFVFLTLAIFWSAQGRHPLSMATPCLAGLLCHCQGLPSQEALGPAGHVCIINSNFKKIAKKTVKNPNKSY